MRIHQFVESNPKILIRDRLFVCFLPAIPFPAVDPFGNPAFNVFRVRDDLNGASLFQAFQSFDSRGQFHPIISRVRTAAEDLAFKFTVPQNTSPSTLTRVPFARAICNQLDVLQATFSDCSQKN